MVEGLFGGDVSEFGLWGVAEGATAGGEDEFDDFLALAGAEALVGAVVFAIDGKHFDTALGDFAHDDFAAGDEDFFVGEADALAGLDGGEGGFEAGDAHDGADERGGFRSGGGEDAALAVNLDLRPFVGAEAHGSKLLGELGACVVIGDSDEAWTEFVDLAREKSGVAASGEGFHSEALRPLADDVESVYANRTGAAEDGELLHC